MAASEEEFKKATGIRIPEFDVNKLMNFSYDPLKEAIIKILDALKDSKYATNFLRDQIISLATSDKFGNKEEEYKLLLKDLQD